MKLKVIFIPLLFVVAFSLIVSVISQMQAKNKPAKKVNSNSTVIIKKMAKNKYKNAA
jgi:hypothetical protein